MKYSELDKRQQKAFKNIKYAAYDFIGGLENTLMDYDEDSTEYKNASEALADHNALVEIIYQRATSMFFREGMCAWGPQVESLIRDINFCGKEWLMQCCEERVVKEGY